MAKPQALPFAVPFAAWFLATQGWRGTARAAVIGGVVIGLLWLPFIPSGGPLNYLRGLGAYQNDVFSVLSLRAWNPWWLVQELGAGGGFVADSTAVLGPLTLRHVGLAIAGLFSIVVFVAVYRRPTAEQLALGLAAISLVAFVSLTTMHERYAYPAFVFLLLAASRPMLLVAWGTFAVALALNLVVAAPPDGWVVPGASSAGIVGAAAITAVAVVVLLELSAASRTRAGGSRESEHEQGEAEPSAPLRGGEVGPASQAHTTAGSAAATCGAGNGSYRPCDRARSSVPRRLRGRRASP